MVAASATASPDTVFHLAGLALVFAGLVLLVLHRFIKGWWR